VVLKSLTQPFKITNTDADMQDDASIQPVTGSSMILTKPTTRVTTVNIDSVSININIVILPLARTVQPLAKKQAALTR
jgi:hypothetical protein